MHLRTLNPQTLQLDIIWADSHLCVAMQNIAFSWELQQQMVNR